MTVNPLTHSFVPIAFMVGMSVLTGAGILVLSYFLGGGRTSVAGDTMYECGLDPMETKVKRFPVKFYVVAMLFILFDVEIALLYPWAVFFGSKTATADTRLFAFGELLVFVAVLVAGYAYLYRVGAFDWARAAGKQADRGRSGGEIAA
jgi:NADH-quinone oxidoreductase subunit A